jgi:hypothetical protein
MEAFDREFPDATLAVRWQCQCGGSISLHAARACKHNSVRNWLCGQIANHLDGAAHKQALREPTGARRQSTLLRSFFGASAAPAHLQPLAETDDRPASTAAAPVLEPDTPTTNAALGTGGEP